MLSLNWVSGRYSLWCHVHHYLAYRLLYTHNLDQLLKGTHYRQASQGDPSRDQFVCVQEFVIWYNDAVHKFMHNNYPQISKTNPYPASSRDMQSKRNVPYKGWSSLTTQE